MCVRLTNEQMTKINEAKANFNKKYLDACKARVVSINEVEEAQEGLRKELEEAREKYIKLNEQIEANVRVGTKEADNTFYEVVALAKKEMETAIEEVHKEAISNNKEQYKDPIMELLELFFGKGLADGVDKMSQTEEREFDMQGVPGTLKPNIEEKELTEAEMIDYIKNTKLHTVAKLYYNLSDIRVSQIRKERMCEHCGNLVEPYNNMVVSMCYYDKASNKPFNMFWDTECEVMNHNGVIEVVDEDTGEVITLARKIMYRDIKCAYEKVKEAEKLTEELIKTQCKGINIGYTEE